MEQQHGTHRISFSKFTFAVFLTIIAAVGAYQNFTVGDSLGWYDQTESSAVDYQKWADNKSFSLGDYLLFNTNSNHSVVRTYNSTVYRLCDEKADDIVVLTGAIPSNTEVQQTTVTVPLEQEGPTYFFSGYNEGEQCKSGQRFSINVTHGQGLPPGLPLPESDSPGPAEGDPDNLDDDSIPDTQIPGNFDIPFNDTTDRGSPPSSTLAVSVRLLNFHFWLIAVYFVC